MSNADWERVTARKPCAVCAKPDYCTRSRETGFACCMRVESSKPMRNGGYLHKTGSATAVPRIEKRYVQTDKRIDFAYLAKAYRKAATDAKVLTLARELGLTVDSLRRLNVGWDGEAWTFEMVDAESRIVGIRRRLPNGKKLSVRGGKEGLFVPTGLNGESPLFITEGPTDCGALLGLGLSAVGRPSCSGGTKYLVEVCCKRRTVIVADDDWPGLRGARELKDKLKDATVIVPPEGKDIREWIGRGATKQDVLDLI